MPLKRTPPPTVTLPANSAKANRVELIPPATSVTEFEFPGRSVNTMDVETTLNKSASDTDLTTTPPSFIFQRNKRRRAQMEDSISNQLDVFKDEMRKLMISSAAQQADELRKVNTLLKDIQQSNCNIENSVSFLAAQNEEFRQKITQLETQAKQDRNHIAMLEGKIEELEMNSRKSNFEIKNVPKKTNENKDDLIEMVLNLSKTVDCNITKSDIKNIYRVRPRSADHKSPPIVVETNSTLLKNDLLKMAKSFKIKHKSKIYSKHLGFRTQEDTPVYLAEHLTPKAARLYFLARDLVKSKNFKFCWTSYGKIYVRENEHTPIISVRNESQIHQLLNGQPVTSQLL
ncbi:unnamed protein product [Euphydryas editha]|uniref:FP protein C-terminal domain-containing protein n=1 Tax=Euphydryas editha TaxID=104508 RepID=A0AAU9VBB3_EUPED|nr:unnamed protein product [Euphydryas editha]